MPQAKPLPPLFEPAMIAERRCIFRTDGPEQFFAAFKFHPDQFEVVRLMVGSSHVDLGRGLPGAKAAGIIMTDVQTAIRRGAFNEWFNERIMSELLHICGLRYEVTFVAPMTGFEDAFQAFASGQAVRMQTHRNADNTMLAVWVWLP